MGGRRRPGHGSPPLLGRSPSAVSYCAPRSDLTSRFSRPQLSCRCTVRLLDLVLVILGVGVVDLGRLNTSLRTVPDSLDGAGLRVASNLEHAGHADLEKGRGFSCFVDHLDTALGT